LKFVKIREFYELLKFMKNSHSHLWSAVWFANEMLRAHGSSSFTAAGPIAPAVQRSLHEKVVGLRIHVMAVMCRYALIVG